MQDTSLKAWKEIKEDGTLAKKQRYILGLIRAGGPMPSCSLPDGGWKRISELEKAGLIEQAGYTINHRTGKRVILWQATNQSLLVKPATVKKETRQQLNNRIEAMGKLLQAYAFKLSEAYDKGFQIGKVVEAK